MAASVSGTFLQRSRLDPKTCNCWLKVLISRYLILQAAMALKTNAGGAIKVEIKQAVDLLSPKTPTK